MEKVQGPAASRGAKFRGNLLLHLSKNFFSASKQGHTNGIPGLDVVFPHAVVLFSPAGFFFPGKLTCATLDGTRTLSRPLFAAVFFSFHIRLKVRMFGIDPDGWEAFYLSKEGRWIVGFVVVDHMRVKDECFSYKSVFYTFQNIDEIININLYLDDIWKIFSIYDIKSTHTYGTNNHHNSSERVQRTRHPKEKRLFFTRARKSGKYFHVRAHSTSNLNPAFPKVCECKWITTHNRPGGEGRGPFFPPKRRLWIPIITRAPGEN